MNFIIQMVLFVAICAAVLPGSSAVPVDSEVQGEQAISMREGDVVKEALLEEIDKSARCTACISRCRRSPNPSACLRRCKMAPC